MPTQVIRHRFCRSCGFKWYTVETRVPDYAIGWASSMGCKPVVRMPVTLTLEHVEEVEMRQIYKLFALRQKMKKRNNQV